MTAGTDPIAVAWANYGRPTIPDRRPAKGDVLCCRCGQTGPGYPARGTGAAVSDWFSDWDRLPWRYAGTGFCPACTWCFGDRSLRVWPHVVAWDGHYAGNLAPAGLRDLLVRPLSHAVSVPLSMQKHVMPWMRYGQVSTDNILLPWGDGEAGRLTIYLELHQLGFGGQALTEPAPRFAELSKLDVAGRVRAMSLWPALQPWRECPPYLEVAARVIRKPKQDTEETDMRELP